MKTHGAGSMPMLCPLHDHVNPCGLTALFSLHAYLMQVPNIELIKMQPEPCLFTHREKPPAWFSASALLSFVHGVATFIDASTCKERPSSAYCEPPSLQPFHSSRQEHVSEPQTACRLEPHS